ncbi:MAG: c-type cytochrome, partial [Verrucomicrobiales bacterium]|nr:c-type cytochrome [Verrucomicrobiales bacterium]
MRIPILLSTLLWMLPLLAAESSFASEKRQASTLRSVLGEYCSDCHDGETKKGGLDLASINLDDISQHPETWETVVRKLRTRQMPPAGKKRPADKTYEELVAKLTSALDRAAAQNPNPGRTETFRRLNRT